MRICTLLRSPVRGADTVSSLLCHPRSNRYSFCFDTAAHGSYGAVVPIWMDRDEVLRGAPTRWADSVGPDSGVSFTVLHLPLKPGSELPDMKVDPEALLFLRKLTQITITTRSAGTAFTSSWKCAESLPLEGGDRRLKTTTITTAVGATQSEAHYVVFSSEDGIDMKLAFPLSDLTATHMGNADDICVDVAAAAAAASTRPGYSIYCYLPICDVGLPFLLHSNFELITSRQKIKCSQHNIDVRDGVAAAFVDAVTSHPVLRENWSRYVPSKLAVDPFWRTLCVSIPTELREHELFQSESGSWCRPTGLLARPPFPVCVTNAQLQATLGLEFAVSGVGLMAYGIERFGLWHFLTMLADAGARDDLRRSILENPGQFYGCLYQLSNAVSDAEEQRVAEQLYAAELFPIVVNPSKVRFAALADGKIFKSTVLPTLTVPDSLLMPRTTTEIWSAAPIIRQLGFGASWHVFWPNRFSPEADAFLKQVGVVDATSDDIVRCIVEHHQAGAPFSDSGAVFEHLEFIRQYLNESKAPVDLAQLADLQASLLIPAADGTLRSAQELSVSSFLGLACKYCCAEQDQPSSSTVEAASGPDEGSASDADVLLKTTDNQKIELVGVRRTWDQADDNTMSILSTPQALPESIGMARNSVEMCHVLNKTASPGNEASSCMGTVAAGQQRVRIDYFSQGTAPLPSNVFGRQACFAAPAFGLKVGFGIESTTADAFGEDIHSFGLCDAGLLYNSRITLMFEDERGASPLKLDRSEGYVISTCLDLDDLTVSFVLNGRPLYTPSDSGFSTWWSLPMHQFADAKLFPCVSLVSGTVTVCFSKAVPSDWMDAQGFVPLAKWATTAQATTTAAKQTMLSLQTMAASPPDEWLSDDPTRRFGWETFLIRLGCRAHHHVCGNRRYWAGLLEGGDLGDCAICMSPQLGDTTSCIPGCRHVFHPNCIQRWLNESNSCPVCRGKADRNTLERPSPDPDVHVLSEQLLTALRIITRDPMSTAATAMCYPAEALLALQQYTEHGFTRTLIKAVPVDTSQGRRTLPDTFVREGFQQLGGRALPFVLPRHSDNPVTLGLLEALGVTVLANMDGLLSCIRSLKRTIITKRHESKQQPRSIGPAAATGPAELTTDDDFVLMAECYGELWRRWPGSSPAEINRCKKRFGAEPLILTQSRVFEPLGVLVWDAPPLVARAVGKSLLRESYRSLRGFFLQGLGIPTRIELPEVTAAILRLEASFHESQSPSFESYLQTRLGGTQVQLAEQLCNLYETMLQEDRDALRGYIGNSDESEFQTPVAERPVPLMTTLGHIVDCRKRTFVIVDDLVLAAAFDGDFVQPDTGLLDRVAPLFRTVLEEHNLVRRISGCVDERGSNVREVSKPDEPWSDWLAEFAGAEPDLRGPPPNRFVRGRRPTARGKGAGATPRAQLPMRLTVMFARVISVEYGFRPSRGDPRHSIIRQHACQTWLDSGSGGHTLYCKLGLDEATLSKEIAAQAVRFYRRGRSDNKAAHQAAKLEAFLLDRVTEFRQSMQGPPPELFSSSPSPRSAAPLGELPALSIDAVSNSPNWLQQELCPPPATRADCAPQAAPTDACSSFARQRLFDSGYPPGGSNCHNGGVSAAAATHQCYECGKVFPSWGSCQSHLRAQGHCGQPNGSKKGLQQRCVLKGRAPCSACGIFVPETAVAAKLLRAFGAIVVQSQHADEDESCMRSRAAWMSIASQMEDVQNEATQPDAVPTAMP